MKHIKKESLASPITLWILKSIPVSNIALFTVIYLIIMIIAAPHHTKNMWLHIIAGSILTASFFLLLKIFDEYTYPSRKFSQRKKMHRAHLKNTAFLCIVIQVAGMFILTSCLPTIFRGWVLLMLGILLMSKEFLTAINFGNNLLLQVVFRALIMPFMIWWFYIFSTSQMMLNTAVQLLMLLSFFAALSFEIISKYKDTDQCLPYADIIIMLSLTAMMFTQYALIITLHGRVPVWFYAISGIAYIATINKWRQASFGADKLHKKRNEAFVGLSIVTGYLLCIFTT